MAGDEKGGSVFRRLAGAFVDLGDNPNKGASDVDALLAGFDTKAHPTPDVSPVTPGPARTALDWTIPEVFAAGKVVTGRDTADTVLALLEGLRAFPPAQQLAMIRAMDAADDTWAESDILADAQNRLRVLQQYGAFIDRDATSQIEAAKSEFTAAQAACDQEIQALDQQIAALQAQRQGVTQKAASAKAQTDAAIQTIKTRADEARKRASDTAAKYKALVTFFGAPTGAPEGK